jgi:hypothetical protein
VLAQAHRREQRLGQRLRLGRGDREPVVSGERCERLGDPGLDGRLRERGDGIALAVGIDALVDERRVRRHAEQLAEPERERRADVGQQFRGRSRRQAERLERVVDAREKRRARVDEHPVEVEDHRGLGPHRPASSQWPAQRVGAPLVLAAVATRRATSSGPVR